MGVLSGLLRRLAEADALALRQSELVPPLPDHGNDSSASVLAQGEAVPDEAEERRHSTQAQAGPANERRAAWLVLRNGKPVCSMVGEPITQAEALEAARWRWPDADVTP